MITETVSNQYNCDLSIDHLKTGAIFGALSSDSIQFLLDRGTISHHKSNDFLFKEGDVANVFYIVLSGEIAISRHDQDNQHRQLFGEGIISFGQDIGYVSMIALLPRVADAMASKDTVTLKIDTHTFAQFHDQFPFDFGVLILNLSRDMARKLRLVSDTLADHKISINWKG
ncbi:cyclic nucleotide-binding domain-containing protein [Marinomonas posidonica]|uniref:Cyclic nucleotide-binding protein n=1 Tax=Marinomonas posidonica (strain CECT 7376 / NCIMB 14433 / IVIA-Po-181) TaxID=491952 RepID=F6D0N8_MARPP|nr:cyclic nucleotide-binding domain-containing protein [Marinomonas posidonica]AEF54836.1 cyclic nucleotide-binding protein [Marinomonas posidonica IVIA-Po-181]